ncbi:copper resistance CopC family protein [Nesterenkonia salmonea]|nr:copper resistance CopC family protein [Nesterenkonia salmonea]
MHATHNAPASLRLGIASLAAIGLGAVASAPAYAHDTLIDSNPQADQVLEEPPHEVVLEFSGDGLTTGDSITNDILVLDSDEENWASEEPAEIDGSTMRTDIPEPLPNGEYEVRYRVVYSDGHDEELGFNFEVDAPLAEGEEDAALAEPRDADATEEAADSTETAEATPTETTDDSADAPDSNAEDASGQWGGPLLWAALAVALAGVAVVAWFAVRRRNRGSTKS